MQVVNTVSTVVRDELNISYSFQVLLAVCFILVYFSEISIDFQWTTWRLTIENINLHLFVVATFIHNISLVASRTDVYYNENANF
jgi:hypothetical protein